MNILLNVYIILSGLLFLFIGVIWNRSDTLNLLH